MASRRRWLAIPALVMAIVSSGGTGSLAQDVCASDDRVQACSLQCCARKSCTPACELDCVKVCVDACGSAATRGIFSRDLGTMRIRCGYPGSTTRSLKK